MRSRLTGVRARKLATSLAPLASPPIGAHVAATTTTNASARCVSGRRRARVSAIMLERSSSTALRRRRRGGRISGGIYSCSSLPAIRTIDDRARVPIKSQHKNLQLIAHERAIVATIKVSITRSRRQSTMANCWRLETFKHRTKMPAPQIVVCNSPRVSMTVAAAICARALALAGQRRVQFPACARLCGCVPRPKRVVGAGRVATADRRSQPPPPPSPPRLGDERRLLARASARRELADHGNRAAMVGTRGGGVDGKNIFGPSSRDARQMGGERAAR